MMRTYLIISVFLLSSFQNPDQDKPVRWRKLRTKDQVRAVIDRKISHAALLKDVEKNLQKERHDFLAVSGDSLLEFISPGEPAAFLISRKWMFRFHFRHDSLQYYTVNEALTGP